MKIILEKTLISREIETRIQKFWDKNNFWENDINSKKPAFCVMMPPPNITGNLHMGHALDNVLTDIICRYKRMDGFDVLCQPGTAHASIAAITVERELSKNGINPKNYLNKSCYLTLINGKKKKVIKLLNQLHVLGLRWLGQDPVLQWMKVCLVRLLNYSFKCIMII